MSTSQQDFLPSQYRSKEAFLASLPPWRRLLATLNWHPTIDNDVKRYAIEQRLLQLKSEIAREAELNARIAALWPSSTSSSTQAIPPPEPGSQI